MRQVFAYIILVIIAATVFITGILIAGGLNPLDIIRGIWGSQ